MIVPLLLVLVSSSGSAVAQTPTRSMVEAHIKAFVAAWASNDPEVIVRVDPPANGFGFRDLQPRQAERPLPAYKDALKAFFATKDYYRVELNELHTEVNGDVGLAWGFWTEEFNDKGQDPEKVRVRFTMTLKYDSNSWRTLLFHRDIQKFDERGRYLRDP
jgi:ketosteroid isomerase-like protein